MDYKGGGGGAESWNTSLLTSPLLNNQSAELRSVEVHVTFLKIGEIDTTKEVFNADVLVTSSWREPVLEAGFNSRLNSAELSALRIENLPWRPDIYIENITGEIVAYSRVEVKMNTQGEVYVTERKRSRGVFIENLELQHFPFDVQDLTVHIVSEKPISELVLHSPGETPHRLCNQSFVDEQEWLLYEWTDCRLETFISNDSYLHSRRPAMKVRCRVARRPWYYVWNMFLIMFFVSCLSIVTFAIPRESTHGRIQIEATLVLTTVAFKFVINQTLPRISYLTYLDLYILTTIFTLVVISCWHAIQTLLPVRESRIDDLLAVLCFASAYLIRDLCFFFRILLGPFKIRREMKKLQENYMKKIQNEMSSSASASHSFNCIQYQAVYQESTS